MSLKKLLFVLLMFSNTIVHSAPNAAPQKIKNLIFVVSDGMGPAAVTMARYLNGRPLAVDALMVGSIRTYSSDSLVTDSAAGGTAYSTGVKTNNTYVAVDAEGQSLRTSMELAKAKGLRTGVVVTSEVVDATPASFIAHVPSRYQYQEIAAQEIDHFPDLMFGGGKSYFLPKGEKGRRQDQRNLLTEAKQKGITVVDSTIGLKQLNQLPALGLFSDDALDYTIDHNAQQPSLAMMSERALSLLEQDNDEGFFLLIESSLIDVAAHRNDAPTTAREVLAYDETMSYLKRYVDQHPDTLLIATSDHETGGLTLGRTLSREQKHHWNLEPVRQAAISWRKIEQGLQQRHGLASVTSALGLTELPKKLMVKLENAHAKDDHQEVRRLLLSEVDRRSSTSWSTNNHTAVDVNLYAYGPRSGEFVGQHENTWLGKKMASIMGLDLQS